MGHVKKKNAFRVRVLHLKCSVGTQSCFSITIFFPHLSTVIRKMLMVPTYVNILGGSKSLPMSQSPVTRCTCPPLLGPCATYLSAFPQFSHCSTSNPICVHQHVQISISHPLEYSRTQQPILTYCQT